MLSIVVAARNDNYGIGFLDRLENFLRVLLPGLARHAPGSELVIVEWNPPADRPRLIDVVSWPGRPEGVTVRILEVPNEIHAGLPNAERLPMFEFLAKNAGIRRAKRDMVLVTNPDILFSESMLELFGENAFQPGWFYRVDRYDTLLPKLDNPSSEAILAAGYDSIFCVHHKNTYDNTKIMAKQRWLGTLNFFPPGSMLAEGPWGVIVSLDDLPDDIMWGLHCNGAGDFILMNSKDWAASRGFAELTDTYTQLDGYMCYQLRAMGVKQAFISPPSIIVHQEHDRMEGRPQRDFWADLRKIRDGEWPSPLNGPGWGLAGIELEESSPY